RGVQMAAQVAQETAGQARAACAVAVGDSGSSFDAGIGTHVVHQGYEAVVENRKIEAEDLLGAGGNGTARLGHGVPVLVPPPGLRHSAAPRGRFSGASCGGCAAARAAVLASGSCLGLAAAALGWGFGWL